MALLNRGAAWALRLIALGALLTIATLVPQAEADDANALALAVKATYLEKFQPFITWPANAFSAPADPFNICVVGADPFGPLLDQAVAGQHFGDRAIAVLRLSAATAESHCQMIYVGISDPRSIIQQFIALQGLPVLTVTDSVAEPAAKGMINFVIADNKIRFEIDNDAAQRAGLSISSKLLSLAFSNGAKP